MHKILLPAVVASLLTVPAIAQDNLADVQIKVHKVAGSVYMLEGSGGNIGVSVGDDGIVIVDDEFAPLAEKIQAALKGITDKPIRFVINTHYHGDHTGGNTIFQEKAPIIAQDNVRKRLASGGLSGNGSSIKNELKPADPKALPIITFDHDVTVHLNGEDIRALHVANGHTDGDSVIFFPKSNVVHMGDDFVTYGFPFIDIDAGGSIRGMIAGIEGLLPQIPADAKIIPGHGPISNIDDVKEYLGMLKGTLAAVERAKSSGLSLDQMKQQKILACWKKWDGDFINQDKFIETIYDDLSGIKPGTFIRHN
jgi:cyclase